MRSVYPLPGPRPTGPALEVSERKFSRDRIIVRLRSTQSAIRSFEASASGAGEPTTLQRLVTDGYVKHIDPIFPTRAPSPGVGTRLLAVAASAREHENPRLGLVSIAIDPAVSAEELTEYLRNLPEVDYAFVPPVKHYAATHGPDPLQSRQWSHAAVRLHTARQLESFADAEEVVVAVVDSGIDEDHPDMTAAIESYTNYVLSEDERDVVGHGTHVAGIIAATAGNAIGIAGLCSARIMAVKALPHPEGVYQPEEYYRGLAHPIDHGAQIINLSLGGPLDLAEREIVEEALSKSIVVVAAMGNDYQRGNPVSYPAAYPGVIAVGASDHADRRGNFSNTGAHIDLLAPGVEILSTVPRHPSHFSGTTLMYDSWDGTSMATPHVAAAAALLLAMDSSLSPKEIQRRLRASTDQVPGQLGVDDAHGSGRLNLETLLR